MEKIKKIIWISGRCGYGKTAFANSIMKEFERENKKTLKLDGEDFIGFLIKNIRTRNPINNFVSYFQNYDLLILDDIDYCLLGKSVTQRATKELLEKITDNNKTRVILITQKRARKIRKLKFYSNQCFYLRLKTPSDDFKKQLIAKWLIQKNLIVPRDEIKEIIKKSNNLFQLKGLLTSKMLKNS